MAKGSSLSAPQLASFAVFVDTSLDTHLAMVVAPEDTVGDLKRKIRVEHALCFPNTGEITIQAMKVRRRASFYHLSDSMLVKSAFDGIKGTWFLHIDALSTCLMECQAGSAENVMAMNVGWYEKNRVLQIGPNSSSLLGNTTDRMQCFVTNGTSTEKSIIQTHMHGTHENTTLPDTLPQILSVGGDSSLPHDGISQTASLQVSPRNDQSVPGDADVDVSANLNLGVGLLDIGISPSELGKKSDPDVPEMQKPVSEGNGAAGSSTPLKSDMVIDQGEKDATKIDCENFIDKTNGVSASMTASKKEKSRRMLERNSQHVSREKKKRKKENDGSFKAPVEDRMTGNGIETCVSSKETFNMENVQKSDPQDKLSRNPASSEGLLSKTPNIESSSPQNLINEKKKKKKKKRSSELQNEVDNAIPSNTNGINSHCSREKPNNQIRQSDHSSKSADPVVSLGKQLTEDDTEEALIKNLKDLHKESDASVIQSYGGSAELGLEDPFRSMDKSPVMEENPEGPLDGHYKDLSKESTATVEAAPLRNPGKDTFEMENVPQKSNSQDKLSGNPASSEGLLSKPPNIESSSPQNPVNEKNKKKKKRRSSKLQNEVEYAIPSDTNGINSHCSREKPNNQIRQSYHSSKSADPVVSLGKQITEEDPEEALINNHKDLPKESDASFFQTYGGSAELGLEDPLTTMNKSPVMEENPEGPLDDSYKGLSKKSNATVEAAPLRNPAELDPHLPSSSNDRSSRRNRKRSKTKLSNNESSKYDVRSSGKHVNEENPEAASGNNNKVLTTKSDAAIIVGEVMTFGTPAEVDSELPSSTDVSRKKKSDKTDLSNLPSSKTVLSSGEQDGEENPKEKLGGDHGEPGNISKGEIVRGEVAALGNPAAVDSAVSSNPKNRNPHRSRKRSDKTELSNHESIKYDIVHSSGKEVNDKNTKRGFENNHKELVRESKPSTVPGEVTALGNSAEIDLGIPSSNNDRSSRHPKKKSAKADLFDQSSTQENLEKAAGNTHKDSGNESNAGIILNGTSQNLMLENHLDEDSIGYLNNPVNKYEQPSSKKATQKITNQGLGNTHEDSGKSSNAAIPFEETTHSATHRSPSDLIGANDHMELPKSDSEKVNFIEFFVPKVKNLELVASAQELASMETDARKSHKEKSKRRKRKENVHSLDVSSDLVNPSSSRDQQMHKTKRQDSDPGNHDLVDPVEVLTSKKLKTRKVVDENNVEKTEKHNVHLGGTSSDLRSPRNSHEDQKLEKLQNIDSGTHHQAPLSNNVQSKHVLHPNEKTASLSDTKLKSLPHNESNKLKVSQDEVLRPKDIDSPAVAYVTQNHHDPGISLEETMTNLAAPSDTTEEDTPIQSKRYRVAVRKIPSSSFEKVVNNVKSSNQKKTLLATIDTIFADAMTDSSSEDELELDNRKITTESASDSSSTSADSDGVLEETQTMTKLSKGQSYMDSPGVETATYGRNDKETDDGGVILTQSSGVVRKRIPLSMILKNSSSYKKAKLTASQSQPEDTESQPFDVGLASP